MPTVSIITPAYNAESYIGEAASSVLGQFLQDWEWIIVDDGSKDGTAALIAEIEDDRIILVSQENRGVSAARNTALDLARGKYITFLDADDTLPQQSLSIRSDFLDRNPNVDIVNGAVSRRSADMATEIDRYLPDLSVKPLFTDLARLSEGVFFNVCYMLRRKTAGATRFDESLSHMEDIVFFLDIADENNAIYGGVNQVVYNYRLNPVSAMSNENALENAYLKFSASAPLRFDLNFIEMIRLRLRIARILLAMRTNGGSPLKGIAAAVVAILGTA